jgi:tRNA 2-thiocytidine biosynthesis protein TtcA
MPAKLKHRTRAAGPSKRRTSTIGAPETADLKAMQGDPRRARTEFNKLQKRLRRQVGEAIVDYEMIGDGDRVMVCLSGGKDSYAMLDILRSLQRSAPVRLRARGRAPGSEAAGLPGRCYRRLPRRLGIEYHVLEKDTYSVVRSVIPEGKTTCGLCSRLRRGTLYGFAEEIGATRIALGTTAMTSSRPCSSTCFSAAASRRCRRSSSPTTAGTS